MPRRELIVIALLAGCGRIGFGPGGSGPGGDATDVGLPSDLALPIGGTSSIAVAPGDDAFAWSGSRVAVAWTESMTTARVGLFDLSAGLVASPTVGTTASGSAVRVAWAGDRFIAAWLDTANHPTFVELSATDLTPLGPTTTITQTTYAIFDALDVSASHVAFSGRVAISVSGVISIVDRATGVPVNTSLSFGAYPARISLVRGGAGFAATAGGASGVISFEAFGSTGMPTTAAVPVPFPSAGSQFLSFSSLAPTLAGYALVAYTVPVTIDTTHTVHTVQVDPGGVPLAPSEQIASYMVPTTGVYPSIISAANRIGILRPGDAGAKTVELVQRCL